MRVLEILMDDTDYYIVMELCTDGNLMEYHNKIVKSRQKFTERDAAKAIK